MKNLIRKFPLLLAASVIFLCSCEKDDDPISNGLYTDVLAS